MNKCQFRLPYGWPRAYFSISTRWRASKFHELNSESTRNRSTHDSSSISWVRCETRRQIIILQCSKYSGPKENMSLASLLNPKFWQKCGPTFIHYIMSASLLFSLQYSTHSDAVASQGFWFRRGTTADSYFYIIILHNFCIILHACIITVRELRRIYNVARSWGGTCPMCK